MKYLILILSLHLFASEAYKYSIQDLAYAVSETNKLNIIIDESVDIEKNFFFYSALDKRLSLNAFSTLLKNSDYEMVFTGDIYYITKKPKHELKFEYISNPHIPKETLLKASKLYNVDTSLSSSSQIVIRYNNFKNLNDFKKFIATYKIHKQVYLEGEILAVSETKLRDVGIDFASLASIIQKTGSFNLGLFSNVNNNEAVQKIISGRGLVTTGDISVFISLLIQGGYAKIVTRPNLLIRSGENSTFKSGQQLRIITGSTESIRNTGEYSSKQYEMLDLGLTLSCSAYVYDDLINLDFDFSVKDIDTYQPNLDQLIISNKSYKSKFSVNDGDSVLLAGLTTSLDKSKTSHVPLLSDIPFIGSVFDHDYKETQIISYLIYFKASIK